VREVWGPTAIGRFFTKASPWSLEFDGERFTLDADGRRLSGPTTRLDQTQVKRGLIWSRVTVHGAKGQTLHLDGIPNVSAKRLGDSLTAAVAAIRHQERVAEQVREFDRTAAEVVAWWDTTFQACMEHLRARGWLTRDFKQRIGAGKPQGLDKLLGVPEIAQHLAAQPAALREAVEHWKAPFDKIADSLNERHTMKMLAESKQFFATVEKSPLTSEQAEAVVCFDNRVLLVASAGSGKTSTMVAKAGYALANGYFEAERMLLLAFNNDAASELRERIKARLEPLGLPADRVVARTFHAFGLDVLGQATGKRPSLASWVESGKDVEALIEIADRLKDKDPLFKMKWDLFRLVFGQDLPKFGKEMEAPEAWDRAANRGGFWTFNNEVVKSRGELLIANWLFYNGVRYVYEGAYEHETADPSHRQYRPDFFLPDAGAYLEHWAVDENGEPPAAFKGYKEGMEWKRQLHAQHGTTLLETTMADLWSGKAFEFLGRELGRLGLVLDPNPDREVPGRRPIENPRMARTFRAFLTHTKSNRLTIAQLRSRLREGAAGHFRFRHEMFLWLFEPLWGAWEARLRAEKCIDFEDMLNLAADCVEQRTWSSPYELIMVDEFQDASQARSRLVSALLQGPDRYLFAVGDDWQSINRFAGADLSVMTNFEARFGQAVTLKLETTFRCPQSLCDISSTFVQKNPKQLRKNVRSSRSDIGEPIRITSVADENRIRAAVESRIQEIAADSAPSARKAKVYVLGRYRKDQAYLPASYDADKVEVEFITVHSSKGLEADHVILPRVTSETLGFPSRVADDPVMLLAMPSGDDHDFAEERRLFYVALTRARSTVTLITIAKKESLFVTELVKDHRLSICDIDGTVSASEVCPSCGTGLLVPKTGRYGPFMGCTSYPRCSHTRRIATEARQPVGSHPSHRR
jgi:DNA helicase IV